MGYPKLKSPPVTRSTIDTFLGYNHNLRIGDNEFYEMENMTADHYPVLCPRARRSVYRRCENPQGMIAKDVLCYADGENFYVGDTQVEGLTLHTACDGCVQAGTCPKYAPEKTRCEKQMVSMGAYVLILPDKVWINTAKTNDETGQYDFGTIENTWQNAGKTVTVSLCKADGTDYDAVAKTKPSSPKDNQLWLDTTAVPHSLKQWSESAGAWVTIPTTYVRIQCTGSDLGAGFCQYDGIRISGFQSTGAEALAGAAVVWQKTEDAIVVAGLVDTAVTTAGQVSIARTMPVMDYVIECANRLWGCRYGTDSAGNFVNEIYCSKLGDFKNWNCFMGISTDSGVLNLGSDGPFTGAITHMDYPLFFKENMLHKVYVSESGAHSVTDTPCRGVQVGCSKSLAIAGEVLYYKTKDGVCAYDGSLPVEVSQDLGTDAYTDAVAGACGGKYYICMADGNGKSLFVYDTAKKLWHRQDGLDVRSFCAYGRELYAIAGDRILGLLGTGQDKEDAVCWSVQTGDIGINAPDMQYLSRLTVRMALDIGAQVSFYVRYDFSPRWEHLCTVTGTHLRSFDIPIRPKRCDTMALRLEGRGDGKVYCFTKTMEQGSEIS